MRVFVLRWWLRWGVIMTADWLYLAHIKSMVGYWDVTRFLSVYCGTIVPGRPEQPAPRVNTGTQHRHQGNHCTAVTTSVVAFTHQLAVPPSTQKGRACCMDIRGPSGSWVSAAAGTCSQDGPSCASPGSSLPLFS